ncbi:ParB/RepB/Spo0J family partition protein [Coxiella burnetii]|uniref:ParB/RepB/Spo0J family partition protein n=1 Tax=Coxiella burnetii TaxID=777 RepID=UPI000CCC7E79|nr:ParB/RepB/Spo0J family partition protein [Coxiella burnetii]PNT87812.1 chromosome partitioning protein ParB [Coxiella burnetii]
MDNSKRNIHNSGPLGMLMKNGQIKKIENSAESNEGTVVLNKAAPSYFKTQAGIEFTEHELIFVDPKECEPWEYANRQDEELGNINELIESIKSNKQLQPALIRKHPHPHDDVKYEIIFGRRRHIACLNLGIPFLAILKEIPNVQDAIAFQDAENKLRNDVSNYSNAILYKRLIEKGVFKKEKDLAEKLRLSPSTLNDLMAYTKIPSAIVKKIPNIHALSKSIVLKIVQLLNKSSKNHAKLIAIAPDIGKSITSPAKLESAVEKPVGSKTKQRLQATKQYKTKDGKKLFTFKIDHRGAPCIVLNKEILNRVDMDTMCEKIKSQLEIELSQSGAPD